MKNIKGLLLHEDITKEESVWLVKGYGITGEHYKLFTRTRQSNPDSGTIITDRDQAIKSYNCEVERMRELVKNYN
jgi:hypothetical protein